MIALIPICIFAVIAVIHAVDLFGFVKRADRKETDRIKAYSDRRIAEMVRNLVERQTRKAYF